MWKKCLLDLCCLHLQFQTMLKSKRVCRSKSQFLSQERDMSSSKQQPTQLTFKEWCLQTGNDARFDSVFQLNMCIFEVVRFKK